MVLSHGHMLHKPGSIDSAAHRQENCKHQTINHQTHAELERL